MYFLCIFHIHLRFACENLYWCACHNRLYVDFDGALYWFMQCTILSVLCWDNAVAIMACLFAETLSFVG